jgi:N-glycosylase/DNA lyase
MLNMHIPPPFNLAATLESGQAHRWQWSNGWYSGVVHGHFLKLRQDNNGIEVRSSIQDTRALTTMLSDYFRLGDDLVEIYKRIEKDSRMSEMIKRYSGMRILRQEPWECLSAFICSATSNLRRIASNMESIADAMGRRITLDGVSRCTFPSAGLVADSGETFLRELGLGFRAKYLAHAASEIARGNLELEELRRMSYRDARTRLVDLPGIGPKIADCVLVFSLDKLEAFPIDRWVSRAVGEWYLDGANLKYDEIVRWAHEYFGYYAGYAQQYLFHGKRLDGR